MRYVEFLSRRSISGVIGGSILVPHLAQRFGPLATELFVLSIDLIKLVWLVALLLISWMDFKSIRWSAGTGILLLTGL
jgi:hypothetical protein